MKKLFLSLILSLFVLCAYAEGISNYKELLAFAKAVNKEADLSTWLNDKGEVCLKADIDMKKGKNFPTIETLKCVFDGCGYKLYNWKTKTSLFNRIDAKAAVKNLVIDASCKLTVKTAYNESAHLISFIARTNRGQIINCENHGDIEHTAEGANKQIYIGAIAALNLNIIYKCKNTGEVSTRFNYTDNSTGGRSLRVGGLVGTCYGKSLAGATISCCENTGSISYMGDFPSNNIGGIVGEAAKLTVKYCVNRGNVVAVGSDVASTKFKGYCRVGGITGWTNNDVLCCDNFGNILVSGQQEAWSAGIVSRPNSTMNIVSCNNYGKVTSNVNKPAYAGGIFAYCVIDAYVSNCYNFGVISSEGTEQAGWSGGIGAVLQSRKGLARGAVIRDCVNQGDILNKSGHKHACTAGILGYGSGRADKGKPVVKARVIDCANYGKITSVVTSRSQSLVGVARTCDVTGKRYEDLAGAVRPLQNGNNVFGRVVDDKGNPVEGVVVSDGTQCVKTNMDGEYQMFSDLSNVQFVTISVPAGYEIPVRNNRPQFFRRVFRYSIAARADFVLKKRENATDNFVLAMIGDPQTRGLKKDKSTERFRDIILKDVAELQQKESKEMYAITLGDLVYNWMFAYDDYVDVLAKASLPVFSVIGNHDGDQRTLFESRLGTPYFESYLAPQNYSFNIGKFHFVVVNTIDYRRPSDKARYKEGLEDHTCKWLENDLKHVPTDHTIVLCGHAPIFKWRNYDEKWVNFKRYSEILAQYKKVYAWAGHTHQNFSYDYKASTKYPKLKNIETIVVGRCIGQIRLNRELNTDGTPNGYMVAEVNGDKMEWYYKTVGKDRDYQMRAYTPIQTNSEFVKVNIWNHSPETWSTPEWWENGVKVADMKATGKEYDPDYLKIYAQHNEQKLGQTERRYSKPSKVPFLFRVVPTAGVRSGEIRVTDQFGKTYVQKVEW